MNRITCNGLLIAVLLLVFLSSCHPNNRGENGTVKSDSTIRTNIPDTNIVSLDTDSTQGQSELDALDLSGIDTTLTSATITDTNKAIMVTRPEAIILIPDKVSLEKEKQADSDGFYSMTDDYNYYTSIAIDSMNSKNITSVFYGHEKRYLVFKNKLHTICTFDGNKMRESWGILMFNGNDTPVLWFGTTPGPAIKKVYGK